MKGTTLSLLVATAVALSPLAAFAADPQGAQAAGLGVPQSIKVEHEDLVAELAAAAQRPGEIGEAARAVEELLRPHFAQEEEFALPPLGLLPRLAEGQVTEGAEAVIAMTDRLRAEQERLFDEHAAITEAISALDEAAQRENETQYARLAERLALHAADEVEVLHPTALLIGEYLKLTQSQ